MPGDRSQELAHTDGFFIVKFYMMNERPVPAPTDTALRWSAPNPGSRSARPWRLPPRVRPPAEEIAMALIRLAHLHFRQGRYDQTRALAGEVLRGRALRFAHALRCAAHAGQLRRGTGRPAGREGYYFQAIDLGASWTIATGCINAAQPGDQHLLAARPVRFVPGGRLRGPGAGRGAGLGEELWFRSRISAGSTGIPASGRWPTRLPTACRR